MKIHELTWAHFKGTPDPQLPYSAHIFWAIQYKISRSRSNNKPQITASVNVKPTSWVRPENKSNALLQHENGHYLIGCLCALEFLKRMQMTPVPVNYNYNEFANLTFNNTLKQYIKMQKRYDEETQHRLNFGKQREWNCKIVDSILQYKQYFDAERRRQEDLIKESNSRKNKKLIIRSSSLRKDLVNPRKKFKSKSK